MEESILIPSPNWFQTCGMAVSQDGWIVYGGPSKCLCVLEPLPPDCNSVVAGERAYKTHVIYRAHKEKIVSVDIFPEWSEKKLLLTGTIDGIVTQWELQMENKKLQITSTHSHDKHLNEKEEVIGVGYSYEVIALTVGSLGNIFKWNLSSNVVQKYNNMLKNFKPLCMSCSPHLPLHIAIGTKQGVVIVMDLHGPGKILYKVRCHEDEILNVSWCPKFEVIVKKSVKEISNKSSINQRLEKIRSEASNDTNTESEEISTLEAEKTTQVETAKITVEETEKITPDETETIIPVKTEKITTVETVNNAPVPSETSGVTVSLPEDSFDETVVVEDDTFDIYKDHEADEFGHKKYQPEDIVVRVKKEEEKNDFLAECMKLKEDILKIKDAPEPSIESLVEAMDKTHVQEQDEKSPELKSVANNCSSSEENVLYKSYFHKHLLATISKLGAFKVWSKSGKLVGSGVPQHKPYKNQKNNKGPFWPTLLWYKPDQIIISDGKTSIFECNALQVDSFNKLETKHVHSYHKRGAYCIASDAPRVQTSEGDWAIYTVAQDRYIIKYCMKERTKAAVFATCGGYIYTIQACPYDAGKVAVSVGDGAVRVWETSTLDEDETRLQAGRITSYWQNVQGKVLSIAWHPTKENLLAFATAEARVGLIDTSGKTEKPARVLYPALSNAVYSLSWGEKNDLYACSSGILVVYNTLKPDEAPETITVTVESQPWELTEARWHPRGIIVGAANGGVAILKPTKPNKVYAAQFVFKKLIHSVEWHPQETSDSNEESPYKNLIAVCAIEKEYNIILLELKEKEEGGHELVIHKTLHGHKNIVVRLAWNPHKSGQLLSSSQDDTVRVWDVASGLCVSIFEGHSHGSIGVAWSAFPQLGSKALSGGGDCALRLWDIHDHPPEAYTGVRQIERKQKRKLKFRNERLKIKSVEKGEDGTVETPHQKVAASLEKRLKVSKKFLLPLAYRQMQDEKSFGIRKLLQAHFDKNNVDAKLLEGIPEQQLELDYVKMFGNVNETNELLDTELQRHLRSGNPEAWIVLSLFRGHVDSVIQYAVERDSLCPFLLSLAPCVSARYWKEVVQFYVAQIDRLVAKTEESRLYENKHYGGPIFRKVVALLSIHDVKSAADTLLEARLFREAYILCKIRYMDSVAEEMLRTWAHDCEMIGNVRSSAICYAALGDPSKVALVLSKSSDQDCLRLAADIAKIVGHNTLAEHIESLAKIKLEATDNEDDTSLPTLPSKADLFATDDLSVEEIDSDDNQ